MKNSFKILLSILSFFFFGLTEGLAYVEIGENKKETLDEAEANSSPNFAGDSGLKKIFNKNRENKSLKFSWKLSSASTGTNNFRLSSLAEKESFTTANSKEFANEETKLYLLFHRLIFYI